MTKFQEVVYMTAKAYWTEKERNETEDNAPSPPSQSKYV